MTAAAGRPLTTYRAIPLLLLCLLLCTAAAGHCAGESNVPPAPRTLVAAIPADLPPTYFLDTSGKPAGFAIDVMDALARRTGLTIQYVSGRAFDDVIQMVLTGKADLIPSLTIDERRKELLAFTDTVGFLQANLFVASGNLTVQGISPGLTIGVMKGSAPEHILMKNHTIRLTTFTNVQTMLFELLAGRVDGIVFLTPNLMKLAIDAGVEDKIRVAGKPIIEAKRAIALRKGETELLTRLNKAIEEFIGSPEYRQIYIKWYGKPKPYWTANRVGAVSGTLLVLIAGSMAFWRYRSMVRINNRLTLSIAEHKQAEEALSESQTKLQAIFDTVGTGIIIIDRDTQIILEANRTAIEMIGLPQEAIIGRICHSLICPAQAGKCPVKDLGQSVDHSERKLLCADGRLKDILKTVYPITIKGMDCYLESFIDISDRKRIEDALRDSEKRYHELSIVDDLTQLYNSRHFYFQLKIELDRSNRYNQPLTLLLLDLDNFKAFNDAYGHIEGDQVLRRLGQVVKRCLRETDFAYRYGGEEFTIILPMTTSTDGVVIAERIRTAFRKETFSPVPGQDVHVTLSIGLAQYKAQEEMKAFVNRVDQLMYQGKKNGKDSVCCESSHQEQFA